MICGQTGDSPNFMVHSLSPQSLKPLSLCSAMVFNVAPTIFEISVVTAILTYKCGPAMGLLTLGTLGAYTAFTFTVTQVCELSHQGSFKEMFG